LANIYEESGFFGIQSGLKFFGSDY